MAAKNTGEGNCKRKTMFEVAAKRKKMADERNKTRVVLGASFERWRALKAQRGILTDALVAKFLLDSYEKVTASSSSTKHLSLSSVSQPPSVSERVSSSNETTVTADEGSVMEQVDNKACVSPDRTQTTVCSVKRCDSWRRNVQCFNLPEDPQVRLHWVQFVGQDCQLFKESSFTDITICKEHFFEECFEKPMETDGVQLKPGAVPTIVIKSEDDESIDSLQQEVPVKTEDSVGQCVETFKRVPRKQCPSCDCTFQTEKVADSGTLPQPCLQCGYRDKLIRQINIPPSEHQPGSIEVTIETRKNEDGARRCTETSKSRTPEKNKADLLQLQGNYLVHKTCEDINLFKSQINHSAPTSTAEHLPSTGSIEVTIEGTSEKESDISDEEDRDSSSDEDWVPNHGHVMAKEPNESLSEENRKNDDKEEPSQEKKSGYICKRIKQLCAECGDFYNVQRPHTCEHKTKPCACNVCGKRFVSEFSLKSHRNIHNETYDHPCKYCHISFKTRPDKLTHEQIHNKEKKPYKCPDCPEMFASNKERRVHLKTKGGPKAHKCDICGIKFPDKSCVSRHMLIHTGVKPYKCSVCERSFKQLGHLKSHMRLHTGERPFKCQHCDKSFNHNVSLKSHIQRFHPNEIHEEAANQTNTEETNQMSSDSEDAQEQSKSGAESGDDSAVEMEVEVNTKKRKLAKPKGRPKKNLEAKLVSRSEKKMCQKKKHDIDEESERHFTDSNLPFDTSQDSDLDYDPSEETKKKGRRGRPRKPES